jgi:hypothetical protein
MSSRDRFCRVAFREQKASKQTERRRRKPIGAHSFAQQPALPSLQMAMTAAQQFDGNSLS